MESAKSGRRTVSGRHRTEGPAVVSGQDLARTNPRSRAVNRSLRASAHEAFAEEVRAELDPRGPLERLAADQVAHSAWRLKGLLENQAARDRSDRSDPDQKPTTIRSRLSEMDRAARSLREAIDSLGALQGRASRPSTSIANDRSEAETEILSNEWPIVPSDDQADDFIETTEIADKTEAPIWQGRLVFDFEVSDVSPVVKGTWITVGHVVSLIVDGWSWADILRSHPELSEEDVRTCVAYAIAEDNSTA